MATPKRNPMARVSTGKAATGRIGAKMVRGGMWGTSPSWSKGKPSTRGIAISGTKSDMRSKDKTKPLSRKEQGIGTPSVGKPRPVQKGADLPGKARTKGTPAMQARGRVGNKYPKGTKWGDDTRRGA